MAQRQAIRDHFVQELRGRFIDPEARSRRRARLRNEAIENPFAAEGVRVQLNARR